MLKYLLPLTAGLITSLATAFLNYYCYELTQFSFFTFGLWFVIPIGAICCGFLAVSGYYGACFWQNKIIDKLDLLLMVALATLSMGLIYYVEYYMRIVREGYSADLGFLEYILLVTEKTALTFKLSKHGKGFDLGEPGKYGYLLFLMDFVGVLVGAGGAFFGLKALDVCATCSLYLRKVKKVQFFFESFPIFDEYFTSLSTLNPTDNNILSTVFNANQHSSKAQNTVKYEVTLKKCSNCGMELIYGEGKIRQQKEWRIIKDSMIKINLPASMNYSESWESKNI